MSKDKIVDDAPTKLTVRSASTDQLENMHNTRKRLQTLQRVATDKENLTGRQTKVGKGAMKEVKTEIKDKLDLKKKKAKTNEKITAEDLTSDAGPSENYWQVLAEKREKALTEALEENKELYEKIEKLNERVEKLIEENTLCKAMLDETKSVVEVLTEMVKEQDESGIDLAEASNLSVTEEMESNK